MDAVNLKRLFDNGWHVRGLPPQRRGMQPVRRLTSLIASVQQPTTKGADNSRGPVIRRSLNGELIRRRRAKAFFTVAPRGYSAEASDESLQR